MGPNGASGDAVPPPCAALLRPQLAASPTPCVVWAHTRLSRQTLEQRRPVDGSCSVRVDGSCSVRVDGSCSVMWMGKRSCPEVWHAFWLMFVASHPHNGTHNAPHTKPPAGAGRPHSAARRRWSCGLCDVRRALDAPGGSLLREEPRACLDLARRYRCSLPPMVVGSAGGLCPQGRTTGASNAVLYVHMEGDMYAPHLWLR